MRKKGLILALVAGLAVCCWYAWRSKHSNGSQNTASDLPPVRVDESRLSQEGRRFFADTKKHIEALRNNLQNTKRKFKEGLYIADDLRLLGDYRSAAEWYLKLFNWYEELPPEQKEGPGYRHIPLTASLHASACFFFIGDKTKGLGTMERFLRHYPSHPGYQTILEFYRLAKSDFPRFLQASAFMRAKREYLK